jgi:hypothetical protein
VQLPGPTAWPYIGLSTRAIMDHLAGPSRHGGVFFDPIKAKSLIIWDVLQGHTMRMNNMQEAVYKPCQHTRAAQAGDGGCPTSRQSLSSLLMGGVLGLGMGAMVSLPSFLLLLIQPRELQV